MTTPGAPASNSYPFALNSLIRQPSPFASREHSTIGSPKPRLCIPQEAVAGGRKWLWRLAPTNAACGGGRPMDARPARRRNRAQPVRWEKLGSEGGQLAGSSPSRRRGTFTTEKRKQIETTESDGKQVAIKKPRVKNPAAH